MAEVTTLLHSPVHEDRLCAVIILIEQYKRGSSEQQQAIYDCYLAQTTRINNWDLVDVSAPHIVGAHLFTVPKTEAQETLQRLASSTNLWERRIAILATFFFIKRHRFDETLTIAKILLADEHDLIHKAVGWMLREAGKRDQGTEEQFLRTHYHRMPRTMLRYAIEKFPEPLRQAYLNGTVAPA